MHTNHNNQTTIPSAATNINSKTRTRRRGRKPHSPNRHRQHQLGLRVSPDEEAILRSRADAMSMTLTAYVRRAALGRELRVIPKVNLDAWRDLARLAANLNQLVREANKGNVVGVDPKAIETLRRAVFNLRETVLGGDA